MKWGSALFTLWVYLGATALMGQTPSEATSRFDAANRAYETEDYSQAIESYEALLRDQHRSAAVYFNLGNAYYQNRERGMAIANYHRALRLNPSHRDAATNLRIAFSEPDETGRTDRAAPSRSFLLRATPNQWTWGFTWPFLALSAALLAHATLPKRRKRVGPLIGPLLAASLVTGTLLGFANAEWNRDWGIVTSAQVAARFGPLSESQTAFQLFEAEEVEILDRKDDWVRVVNTRNESGWVRAEAIEVYTDFE